MLLDVLQRLGEMGDTAESGRLLNQVTKYFEYHEGDYPAAKISNGGGPSPWKL
jgi:hypothetical protein